MDLITNDLKTMRMPDMVQRRLSLHETGQSARIHPGDGLQFLLPAEKDQRKLNRNDLPIKEAGFRYQTSNAALGKIIVKMFETAKFLPETFCKSFDGLLHLLWNNASEPIKQVLETTLQYRIYQYGFVCSSVKSKCEGLAAHNTKNKPVMPSIHENVRGKTATINNRDNTLKFTFTFKNGNIWI